MKKIFTPVIVPLVLSVILHFIFIAGAYRLGLFVFVSDLSDKPMTATLISEPSENTSRPLIAPKIKTRQHNIMQSKVVVESDEPGPEVTEPPKLEEPALAEVPSIPQKDTLDSGTQGATETAAAVPVSPQITPPAIKTEGGTGSTVLLKFSGEKLSYSLYWLGIHVGNAELEAVGSSGMVIIKCQVHSTPVISAFYRVDDHSESMVANGVPVHFRIKQKEGKYRSDKETIFDTDKKLVTFFNYIKGTKDDYPIQGGELWDLISGFYYLRTQPFEVGKTININIFDSNKFFQAEVNVIGKEQVRFSETKIIDTVKVKPVIKSEGLFQNKGDIMIWLTDDDNKTPVKVETKAPIGKVVAILKSLETGN
ncbi:MAG: DUF3108 domain-containing protein [Dissulfurispiraceae bacterium]